MLQPSTKQWHWKLICCHPPSTIRIMYHLRTLALRGQEHRSDRDDLLNYIWAFNFTSKRSTNQGFDEVSFDDDSEDSSANRSDTEHPLKNALEVYFIPAVERLLISMQPRGRLSFFFASCRFLEISLGLKMDSKVYVFFSLSTVFDFDFFLYKRKVVLVGPCQSGKTRLTNFLSGIQTQGQRFSLHHEDVLKVWLVVRFLWPNSWMSNRRSRKSYSISLERKSSDGGHCASRVLGHLWQCAIRRVLACNSKGRQRCRYCFRCVFFFKRCSGRNTAWILVLHFTPTCDLKFSLGILCQGRFVF